MHCSSSRYLLPARVWGRVGKYLAVFFILLGGSPRAWCAALEKLDEDQSAWELNLGREFPGAKGTVERVRSADQKGGYLLKLASEFSGGGKYVGMARLLRPGVELEKLSFRINGGGDITAVGVRLMDSTGQIHQQHCDLGGAADWKQVVMTEFGGGVHWSGANDGKWHGPAMAISFLIEKGRLADTRATSGAILVDDITMHGSYLLPAGRLGSLDVRLSSSKPMLYFWGQADRPDLSGIEVISTGALEVEVPSIRLLNFRGEEIAEVGGGGTMLGGGKTRRWKIALRPPEYGLFYLAMDSGRDRLRIPVAWLAEPARDWPDGPFGVQMHFAHGPLGRHQVFGGASGALRIVRKMGASWVRDEIGWGHVEAEPGKFSVPLDEANIYHFVRPAREEQLRPMVTIGGVNKAYDEGLPPTTAEGLAGFQHFVRTVVQQCSPAVKAWEIWNEPNLATGWHGPKPNAAEYAAILRASYTSIKAADPSATVVGVACSGVDLKFIEGVLRQGGGKHMDAISVHPYLIAAPEAVDPRTKKPEGMGKAPEGKTFVEILRSLTDLLDRYEGAQCKLWLTEIGYGAWKEHGYTDSQAAAYEVRQVLLALSVPRVERIFKYNFQDKAVGQDASWDKIMGLVRFDGAPKPAFVAYNTLARALFKKSFTKAHETAPEARVFEFSGDGGRTFAVWSTAGPRKVSVETNARSAVVTDLMGNDRTATTEAGRLVLNISEEPTFVAVGSEVTSAVAPRK